SLESTGASSSISAGRVAPVTSIVSRTSCSTAGLMGREDTRDAQAHATRRSGLHSTVRVTLEPGRVAPVCTEGAGAFLDFGNRGGILDLRSRPGRHARL